MRNDKKIKRILKTQLNFYLTVLFMSVALFLLPLSASAQLETDKIEAEGELVADFPIVPIYPDAVIERSYKKIEAGKVGYEAVQIAEASVFDVYSYFIEELKREGWTITMSSDNSPTALEQGLTAVKDKMTVQMEIEDEDGHTEIIIEIPLH